MHFTLAVSAATAAGCAALVRTARGADPRTMPIPGPAQVTWRSPDRRAAVMSWGTASPESGSDRRVAASQAGTIWADPAARDPATVCARTGLARVDPVYLAEVPGGGPGRRPVGLRASASPRPVRRASARRRRPGRGRA